MRVIENEQLTQSLVQEQKPREGIHLTDLTSPCLRKVFLSKTQRLPQTTEDFLRLALGRGHHEMLEESPSAEVSLEADGIKATLDGLERDGEGDMVVAEYKTTRASAESSPERFPWWLEQVMGYAWMWGTTKARLYVVHMVGSHKNRDPQIKAYDLIFDGKELQENWQELIRRRDILQRALDLDDPPEGPRQDMEWACKNCSGRNICAELRRKQKLEEGGKE